MTSASAPSLKARLIEFVAFVATGSLAALANLVAGVAFRAARLPFPEVNVLGVPLGLGVSVVFGYVVGMVVAFILFQKLIFGRGEGSFRRRVSRFTQVNLLGLALSVLVAAVTERVVLPALGWTFRPDDVAHFIGICVPAFSSFVLHKHYTWK